MIAKARSISHGINAINYMAGISHNKKHPEKIHHICDQFLSPNLDTMGIWNEMKQTTMFNSRMKKNVISFEICPPIENTKDFSLQDWEKLWKDFAEEFDKIEIEDDKGNLISGKTNISGSKATVWLHEDSKSGKPHLHIAACRVDENGNTNNDHMIHLRAQWAAEQVAIKYGWETAESVSKERKAKFSKDCLDILKRMKEFDLESYFFLLEKGKKYKLHFNKDKDGNLKGYSLSKGNLKYKASELGTSRNLTISNLKKTWYKFHPNQNPAFDYTRPAPGRIKTDVYSGSHREVRYIPEKVLNMFNQAFNESVCRGWRAKLGEALYRFACLRANLSQISISHVISAEVGSGENREFEINNSGDTYEAQIEFEMALQIINSLKAGISRSRSYGMGI